MTQNSTSATYSNRLIIVGDELDSSLFDLSALKLPLESNPHLERFSVEQFNQAAQLNDLIQQQQLVLVVADQNSVITQSFDNLPVFVIAANEASNANVFIPSKPSVKSMTQALRMGFEFLINKNQVTLLNDELKLASSERVEFSKIGIALSAEKDLDKLLNMVLQEGRRVGDCEAASLYLLINQNDIWLTERSLRLVGVVTPTPRRAIPTNPR